MRTKATGRPYMPRELRVCTAGCGRAVVIIAGDEPRGNLLCEPCRGPGPFKQLHPECSREGCTNPVRVCGRRLRPYELGRPVYCSVECRRADHLVVTSCAQCAKPIARLASRFDGDHAFCDRTCHVAFRVNPDRECARCGTPFHPDSPRRRFCSRACGVLGEGRGPASQTSTCPWCKKEYRTGRTSQLNRPCSRACANRWWRYGADWTPGRSTRRRDEDASLSGDTVPSCPPTTSPAPASPPPPSDGPVPSPASPTWPGRRTPNRSARTLQPS